MPADPTLIQEGYNEFILMDQRTSLENTMSLGNPLLRMSMGQIEAPTLLVAGRQDMIVPSPYIEAAAQIIPNCRTAWIDQCGHIPMIEQRAAYQRALHAFLAGTTRVTNIDQAA